MSFGHGGDPYSKEAMRRLRMINKKAGCPLCNLDLGNEEIFYEDGYFLILRTKQLKGHIERIMIIAKEHTHTISHIAFENALDAITTTGRLLFKHANKLIIMDSTFSTINEHWHLVATDLSPESSDFFQILRTKWLKVIDLQWD